MNTFEVGGSKVRVDQQQRNRNETKIKNHEIHFRFEIRSEFAKSAADERKLNRRDKGRASAASAASASLSMGNLFQSNTKLMIKNGCLANLSHLLDAMTL